MQQTQQQEQIHNLTFRDFVDMAIVFGCIPALILTFLFWAIATAFPHAGALPSILALVVTLLLAFMGSILVVRYVDISAINWQKLLAAPTSDSDDFVWPSFGAGLICLFLAVGIVMCLSLAGTLEGWHYTLMGVIILLVGYQTWRVFLGRQQ